MEKNLTRLEDFNNAGQVLEYKGYIISTDYDSDSDNYWRIQICKQNGELVKCGVYRYELERILDKLPDLTKTQEEKQLLLKDLCARLPYGVKYYLFDIGDLNEKVNLKELSNLVVKAVEDGCIIPYLRPMSSMTEDEKTQYRKTQDKISVQWDDYGQSIGYVYTSTIKTYDWLNKNHFDYRGLIPIGLAIEAPEGMYK